MTNRPFPFGELETGVLSPAARVPLEICLGADLSGVLLHKVNSGPAKGRLAWTVGEHVFLNRRLDDAPAALFVHVLGHELAHVLQQRGGRVPMAAGAVCDASLEREADALGNRAVALATSPEGPLRTLTPQSAVCRLPAAFGPAAVPPSGPVQCYPIVIGREADLPHSAEAWLRRFHFFGRYEPEIAVVLAHLEATHEEFKSERDLVAVVRLTAAMLQGGHPDAPSLQAVRPPRPVCIGIPYRADRRGEAILDDVEQLRKGVRASGTRARCEIVVLLPIEDAQALASVNRADLGRKIYNKDGAYMFGTLPGIDALYISGGPHDHPDTVGEGKPRAVQPQRATEAARRHEFETQLLLVAAARNIPILGVCGGSWGLAATRGGQIQRLGELEKAHAGPMTATDEARHTVVVSPMSMLGQILATDNYRAGQSGPDGLWPEQRQYKGLLPELPVNSVHWAQSVFAKNSGITVSATDHGVTEAFEDPSLHFCMGIQWHPEYAQDGLKKQPAVIGEIHARPLHALAQAAEDGRAARVIQKAWRAHWQRTHPPAK
jgi:gamma-glutamyl-gamma-aminobutyrate hydrolase PuuD